MTGNWATRTNAEVDGIEGSRFHPDGMGHTLVVQPLVSLKDDHEYPPSVCAMCRTDLGTFAPGAMSVPPMTPAIVACQPYSWLA